MKTLLTTEPYNNMIAFPFLYSLDLFVASDFLLNLFYLPVTNVTPNTEYIK